MALEQIGEASSPSRRGREIWAAARVFMDENKAFAAISFLALFPLVMPYEALAVKILVFGLYAAGFNLLFGYTGMLSFGHAAFLGSGAYGAGIAIVHWKAPFIMAVAGGVALAILLALIMGYLSIRTRGIYFSMVTLALSQCVYYVFYQSGSWTGGENGLRGINISKLSFAGFQIDFIDPRIRYYVIFGFVAFALWFLARILASPFGAVLEAIRENEKRASACGYNVANAKLLAFVLSGGFCGLAGALWAVHLSVVPIETLHYLTSGEAVIMCLLGGMGTYFGPFVGAAIYLLFEDLLTLQTSHWQLYLGAFFILCVLFFPRGVWGSTTYWIGRR